MTDKEAMKLALFALDIVKIHYTQSRHVNEAITALKERLAQDKALQALHNENERLGLYKDAYAEPVAQYSDIVSDGGLDPRNKFDVSPQRTEPPQKKVWTFWDLSGGDITDAIKAKLKEKNNG
jgi:hypothetical protein